MHDIGGINGVIGSAPVVELSVVSRSQPMWLFALSCLAAIGLDHLCAPRRRPAIAAITIVAGAAALLLAALVSQRLLRDYFAGQPSNGVAGAVGRAAVGEHLRFIGLTFAAGVCAIALMVMGRGRSWGRLAGGGVLIAMVFAQSGFLLRHYNPTIEPQYFYPTTPAMAAVLESVGTDTVLVDGLLNADVNLWYRLHMPTSYDGSGVENHDLLYRRILAVPDHIRWERLAKVLGVRYVATTGEAPGWPRVAGAGAVNVFRVPGGVPRYFSPAGAQPVSDNEEALRILERAGFDTLQTALIHHAGVGETAGAPGTVEVLREDAEEIRLRVDRASAGWLVALSTRFPGWEATVNGKAVPLRRANVAFTAVPVEAGPSDVVLRYRPKSVKYGLAVTAGSLLVVAGLMAWSLRPVPAPGAGGRRRGTTAHPAG